MPDYQRNNDVIMADLAKLAAWAGEIESELRKNGDAAAADEVKRAIDSLGRNTFALAVLGKAKRGKSTLINAMLGRGDDMVAPIDRLPASSAITRFRWSEKEFARVSFRDGRGEDIPYSRIREFVTEEGNPDNRRDVALVEVGGPFPGMNRHMELVDTPGAGSIHEHHDAILHAFIPQADAVVCMVTARMPLDQDELELLQKVKAADIQKIFFVINKVDEADEADIVDAISHNQKLLSQYGIPVTEIRRLSARNSFRGQPGGGVQELWAELNQFIAQNRLAFLRTRFIGRVLSAAEAAMMSLDVKLGCLNKSDAELERDIEALREAKKKGRADAANLEREFETNWSNALNELVRGMSSAKNDALEDVSRVIASTSSFQVGELSKDMPTILTRIIENAVEPHVKRFEDAGKAACNSINASYPTLVLGEAGGISLKSSENVLGSVTGVAGGTLAAAGGAGLALAGASAATTIAAANAAALAATTTIAVNSVPWAGGLVSTLAGWLGASTAAAETAGGLIAGLTTSSVAVATPGAITTAPLWVALSGPVGWTLAGIGLLAIPLSWKLSKGRQKAKLGDAAGEHIKDAFKEIKNSRLPQLRDMQKQIIDGLRTRLAKQMEDIEEALDQGLRNRPDPAQATLLQVRAEALRGMIGEARQWL
jgi:ribosome biogenesis GTPase A